MTPRASTSTACPTCCSCWAVYSIAPRARVTCCGSGARMHRALKPVLVRSALLLLGTTALGSTLAADLEVKDAWVRGTVPAQKATGAFMQISSKSGATITGAASPVARVAEVHQMTLEGDTMRMRLLPRL